LAKKLSLRKLKPNQNEEKNLQSKGFRFIAGLDEVGRGSLAGPLVAAACVFEIKKKIYRVRDSKALSAKMRRKLSGKIKRHALSWSIGAAEVEEIEKFGIQKATYLAFGRALKSLKKKCDFVLVDGFRFRGCRLPQKHIIKGDAKCFSIACASILAKVYRDSLMRKLAKKYPGYYLHQNKGYGTLRHLKALKKHGPCEIHRRNFRPVNKFLNF